MKRFTIKLILLTVIFAAQNNFAQLTTPDPEEVYGGRILAMTGYAVSASETRIFISTASANSIFYADIQSTGTPSFGTFTVMPGVGDDDGYGSNIRNIDVDGNSGYLFFITENGDVVSAETSSGTVTTAYSGAASSLLVYESTSSYLYFIDGSDLHFGTLDASGNFTEDAASPINIGISGDLDIFVSPSTNKLYIAQVNNTFPMIHKSSDDFDALSGATTFSTIDTTPLNTGTDTWKAADVGPDGTIFLQGQNSSGKRVAYTEDEGTNWTLVTTSVNGVSGSNFAFAGTASPYTVYFAKCYATFTSGSGFGTFSVMGDSGYETHSIDGPVFSDPLNTNVVCMATDQGIGGSTDGGATIYEIDDGVEAVQIRDFDMSGSKTTGWTASHSGIRRVTDYTTTPTWTNAIFPNGDGSSYYSVDMVEDNGDRAFAGNVRVYETTDAGTNWSMVFTAENAPYNFPGVGSSIQAIEVCPYDTNIVMAGYFIQNADQGGLFYSSDGGTNWDQLLCKASATGNDVDVYDIVFTQESGNIVAYVGVYYDTNVAIGDRGRSIYRCEWDAAASSWSVRQDMDGAYTAAGYAITATIIDLETSVTGDTLFACGTDAGSNHPIAYYKILNGANLWTSFTTNGFPSSSGQQGKAITVGNDTCYVAVDNEIYTLDMVAGTVWSSAYSYPNGTEINVLFYDDLLVGTGTGLYSQSIDGSMPVELTSFSASLKDDKVELCWNTATEINNYGFEIERTFVDEKEADWEAIGFVYGHGNSSSPKDYLYYDNNLKAEKIKYRLKQIDTDGLFEYFPNEFGIEIEIGVPEKFELFQNYPNPFSKSSAGNPTTTIKYSLSKSGFVSLKVFNVLGAEVTTIVSGKQNAGRYQVNFNAAGLSSGVYFYALRAGGVSIVKKMILLR